MSRMLPLVVLLAGSVAVADDKPKPSPAKAARDKPLASKDDAKFFGPEAWKAFGAAADRLYKEKKTDFVVETVEAPAKDAEKVRAMTPTEREKHFGGYVRDRVKAEKVGGVYLFVCKSPPFLYVDVTEGFGLAAEARKKLADELRKTLLATFREKKFDEGLTKAADMILEAKGLGGKK